jgi:hypothetical protein
MWIEGVLMFQALSVCPVAMKEVLLKTWPEEKRWLWDYSTRHCLL